MPNFCNTPACPILLSSCCVFYEGANLLYIGINTNDSLQDALEKIDDFAKNGGVSGTSATS